jgi:sulfoacetaldehyde acetyltransferase
MDQEQDDPGTTWNERARTADPDKITARMAWRAVVKALPKEAMVSWDIGNSCAIGNAYPSFEQGRKYLAPGMFGPCGYAFPAILGAKIAHPQVPAVGFAGDGAFGISMNEWPHAAGMTGLPSPWSFSEITTGAQKNETPPSGMTTISWAQNWTVMFITLKLPKHAGLKG